MAIPAGDAMRCERLEFDVWWQNMFVGEAHFLKAVVYQYIEHFTSSAENLRSREMKRFLLVFIPFLAVGHIFSQSVKASPADNASTPATATSANKPYGQYGSHLEPILKTINASPDQRDKISAVVNEFKPKIEPSIVKYREKRDQFLQSMITGKASEDIMSKQDEMNQLSSQINNQYMVMNLKVRKLLKPDQIEPYENYRKKQGWVK